MFRTISLSIAAIFSLTATASACEMEVDVTKAYRVINRHTAATMSEISFEPQIEWINGHPYVTMLEFEGDLMGVEVYSYHDIILAPINANNVIFN